MSFKFKKQIDMVLKSVDASKMNENIDESIYD